MSKAKNLKRKMLKMKSNRIMSRSTKTNSMRKSSISRADIKMEIKIIICTIWSKLHLKFKKKTETLQRKKIYRGQAVNLNLKMMRICPLLNLSLLRVLKLVRMTSKINQIHFYLKLQYKKQSKLKRNKQKFKRKISKNRTNLKRK